MKFGRLQDMAVLQHDLFLVGDNRRNEGIGGFFFVCGNFELKLGGHMLFGVV